MEGKRRARKAKLFAFPDVFPSRPPRRLIVASALGVLEVIGMPDHLSGAEVRLSVGG